MNISIIGMGYVGCTMAACLSKSNTVYCVEIDKAKLQKIESGKSTFYEPGLKALFEANHSRGNIKATDNIEKAVLNSEVSFITVNTPTTEEGNLDLSHVYDVAESIGKALIKKDTFHTVVIRSTTAPGTVQAVTKIIEMNSGKKYGESFAVVSNPEFLREGNAVTDFFNPEFILIGSDNQTAIEALKSVYCDVDGKFVISEIKTAEIMKYVCNSYHALKICFANEIGNICKALNIDGNEVMDIFGMDKKLNISTYYFKPGQAYGGSCLSKDLKATETLAKENNVGTPLISAIGKSNEEQILYTARLIKKHALKKVGVYGLTFKNDTDDLRNSSILKVIENLLKAGLAVDVYDEILDKEKKLETVYSYMPSDPGKLLKLCKSCEEIISDNDVIVFARSNNAFRDVCKAYPDKCFVDLCGQFRDKDLENIVFL